MIVADLLGEEWANALPRAESYLQPIKEELTEERRRKVIIYPDSKNIFRVFKELAPAQIKVVILGQDVYHNKGQATGRAFECGNHPSPSWRKITEIYKKSIIDPNPEVVAGKLSSWSEQGVFLLNKALTVREHTPNVHTKLWEPFTKYVVSTLLSDMIPRAYIILGGEAKKMIPKVPHPNKGFYYEHPAFASYENRTWRAESLFPEVNRFLDFHGHKIKW